MTKHDKFRSEHIVDAINTHQEEFGHPPSIRQLMEMTGLASTAAVHYHLRKLLSEGRVRKCDDECGRYWAMAPSLHEGES